jgi:hypothetical protein
MKASAQHSAPRPAPVTVPAMVLALAPLADADRELLARVAGVELGDTVEVDLRAAEDAVPGSARVLMAYWMQAKALWDDLSAGRSRPGARTFRRTLVSARQVDTKTDRRDLSDELFALTGNPVLAQACEILEANPDAARLEAVGVLTRSSDRTQVAVTLRGQHHPDVLGGPRARSEVARHFCLEASHAAWRDRKARRFTRIDVTADEVWPAAQAA